MVSVPGNSAHVETDYKTTEPTKKVLSLLLKKAHERWQQNKRLSGEFQNTSPFIGEDNLKIIWLEVFFFNWCGFTGHN